MAILEVTNFGVKNFESHWTLEIKSMTFIFGFSLKEVLDNQRKSLNRLYKIKSNLFSTFFPDKNK